MTLPGIKYWKISTKIVGISVLTILFAFLGVLLYFLPIMREKLTAEKRAATTSVVDVAYSLVADYDASARKGEFDIEEAQKRALGRIKTLRYKNNDYVWVNDMEPRMLMHPMMPELDGKYLNNFMDPDGKKLFIAMIDVCKVNGSGFVDYRWPKPGERNPVPKISFVRLYKPWGWIIGSGIYADDIEKSIEHVRMEMIMGTIVFAALTLSIAYIFSISITKKLERAHDELKSAHSQLLQQEKLASIGQLAAGVAHEINNPTGYILSNLNSLEKYVNRYAEFILLLDEAVVQLADKSCNDSNAALDKLAQKRKALKIDYVIEDTKQLVQESISGAEKIKRIVQDLKSFSHVDDAEYRPADINEGIESTINIAWNELKYKATVKKEYGNIPMVNCNLGQLNQVFINILVNAAQAIEKQGEITVKTWPEGNYVNVSIADTGAGIPGDIINRIFDPFYTTKDVGKGTGLGLSIAYDIVKKHSGEIKVTSEVGKGTTFTIKIPTDPPKGKT